jgi:hypothetical protein
MCPWLGIIALSGAEFKAERRIVDIEPEFSLWSLPEVLQMRSPDLAQALGS